MLPSALALVAVVGVVLLLIGVFGRGGSEPTSLSTPTSDAVAPTPTPSTSVVTSPAPSVSVTTPAPSVSAPVVTTAPVSTALPTDLPDLPTVVLNSTDEPGLAGRVSAYLESLGWAVGTPGNFTTVEDTTTVYYPEGYEAVARALAAVAPGSGSSVAEAIPEVAADALTVVLGEDAAGWVEPGGTTTTTSPAAD